MSLMTISSRGENMEIVNERQIKGIYKSHDQQKFNGSHYTPTTLAHFVASRMLFNFNTTDRTTCSIFDPAVGDGELLFSLAEILISRGLKVIEIYGFDIDPVAVSAATERISQLGSLVKIHILEKDFTAEASSSMDSYSSRMNLKFDLIIANPPYVRTQSLGAKSASKLSSDFSLEGRIDLYYVFLLGIKKFMHKDTIAGFIVSNRFMTTKSGSSVRKGLLESYHLDEVWDLGDTRLFSAAVLPAVIIFSDKKDDQINYPAFTSIYSTKTFDETNNKNSAFEAVLSGNGFYSFGSENIFEVKTGNLLITDNSTDIWRVSNEKSDDWLAKVEEHTESLFSDIGKIRVGVKTTADKVFIPKKWTTLPADLQPESDVLKPLITHHFARRFKQLEGNDRKILYPHISIDGKKHTINLKNFPNAEAYLNSYKELLAGREYLIQGGRQWFEIWVPHDPALWEKPKIVFRDISDKPTFWMDKSGAIVNGDCYWITAGAGIAEDLLWIALAVANSTFIELFYDQKFNNKLYAGRRRFMTQYVEQFPIPKMNVAQKDKLIMLTKKIYNALPGDISNDEKALDRLVWESFGF